eukprot:12888728-Alexandrium_andersonii.AAC.1
MKQIQWGANEASARLRACLPFIHTDCSRSLWVVIVGGCSRWNPDIDLWQKERTRVGAGGSEG